MNLFKLDTGLPYYVNHTLIGIAIGLLFQNMFVGASFYAGREIRDWEKLGHFDHRGFWWPVAACVLIETLCMARDCFGFP